MMRSHVKGGHLKAGHEVAFKPAKAPDAKLRTYSAYEHKPEYVHRQKNFKDEEGNVVTAPRNFLTNPPKKGMVGKQTTFMDPPEHMADNYDALKEIAHKERLEHETKLQEKPFSQKVKQTGVFNPDKAVYGEDIPIPHRKPAPKRQPPIVHEVPFKPSNPPRKGYNKCLDKFPEYKPNPTNPVKRKMPVEGQEEPPKFKMTHNVKTRPTPSIATNMRNLKASFPSVFRR